MTTSPIGSYVSSTVPATMIVARSQGRSAARNGISSVIHASQRSLAWAPAPAAENPPALGFANV
jgi:hypothetical protein